MKNKYIIYTMLFAMTAITSCKKDSFLNRYPLSDISPQSFFKNETDLQLYCNQYYSQLPVQNFLRADDNSDDKAPQSINSFLAGTYTVPNSASGTAWDFSFIRTLNFFLANYSKANVSDSIKNIYVGETLFFRALDYWNKVKTFGDVPYIDKYITDTSKSALYGVRMQHKQVMDSVLKDLNFAVDHIPVSTADGRLNKYDALALKSRICLWEGTYREYWKTGDQDVFLQAALDAAEQIMNSGKFGIYSTGHPQTDYYNLFIQEELKDNPESIMCMRYLPVVLMNGIDRSLGEAGDGYSKDFVRSFLCTDGLPTDMSSLYKGDDSLDEEIINRDPRLKQQIATRGFDFLAGDTISLPRIGTTVTSTGYQCTKGRSSSLAAWNANASTYDFFIFRYAETLLIYAEAKAELANEGKATFTQDDLDKSINLLRDRVGMPHMTMTVPVDPWLAAKYPLVTGPLKNVILEIRRERRVELGSEGFRFDDLHRWHAGDLINNPETILGMKLLPSVRAEYPPTQVSGIVVDNNDYIRVYPSITARKWDDKMYLYPIPLQEITLNPNLKQNPGW
ncbi:MAG: RagB/SusD family nutrient uptake outer membrane protein [Chitinophagaceae bacterium]|nr:MAG: RagB/SusD family nutrient uptake outer membrane protein [Chitinophagaceae bacterium]